jgi:dihydroorotase
MRHLQTMSGVFQAMAESGMLLPTHGEVTNSDMKIFDL